MTTFLLQCARYVALTTCVWMFLQNYSMAQDLSLAKAIRYAKQHDPWLTASEHQQRATEAESLSAGTLPDPVMSLGLANMPTDTFDFDQEGMTQFKIGVEQKFARGNSRSLKKKQLAIAAQRFPLQRADRLAQVEVIVTESWLNTYRAQQSIDLIKKDKALFSQLVDIVQANYASTSGKARQQDIIRAQLELTRIEDRLTVLGQQEQRAKTRLAQWLPMTMLSAPVTRDFPELPVVVNASVSQSEWLMTTLSRHPAILAMDKAVSAESTSIAVAKQAYQPEFGVNASYGYRDDTPMGEDRADFFSIGVTFDLPIFTDEKQDQHVKAAISRTESVKTQKLLMMQKMRGQYYRDLSQLTQLDKRRTLYNAQLLPQIEEQAEASLTAYTNDDGDFSEVIRARIDALNAHVDALNIEIDRQVIIARLNYYAAGLNMQEPQQ